MHDYTTLRLLGTVVRAVRARELTPLTLLCASLRHSAFVFGAIYVTHPQMDHATGSVTLWLKAYIDYIHL